MTDVLITGANGLVGQAVLQRLLKDETHRIIATDYVKNDALAINRFDITNWSDASCWVQCVDEKEDSVIIHLAARVAGPPSVKQPYAYLHTNVDGTLNILDHMVEFGVKKLITMSSWSTFGGDIELPITEETEQKPSNPYGVSKTMCDQLYELYAKQYGLEIINLRPTMIYGPKQTEKNIVQEVLDCMETGQTFEIWGEGTHTRELLHVSDMAEIIRRAMDYTPENGYEVFIVGTENPLQIKNVVEAGSKMKKFKVKYVPSNKWVFSQRSDMTKIKTKMGIDPSKFINIRDGLFDCYQWRLWKHNI